MCILQTFLCQGTKKGLERNVWQELVGRLFCYALYGADHDDAATRYYDRLIVW